jgi:hypothetical protein
MYWAVAGSSKVEDILNGYEAGPAIPRPNPTAHARLSRPAPRCASLTSGIPREMLREQNPAINTGYRSLHQIDLLLRVLSEGALCAGLSNQALKIRIIQSRTKSKHFSSRLSFRFRRECPATRTIGSITIPNMAKQSFRRRPPPHSCVEDLLSVAGSHAPGPRPDWQEVGELITGSYRLIAPRRLALSIKLPA